MLFIPQQFENKFYNILVYLFEVLHLNANLILVREKISSFQNKFHLSTKKKKKKNRAVYPHKKSKDIDALIVNNDKPPRKCTEN